MDYKMLHNLRHSLQALESSMATMMSVELFRYISTSFVHLETNIFACIPWQNSSNSARLEVRTFVNNILGFVMDSQLEFGHYSD